MTYKPEGNHYLGLLWFIDRWSRTAIVKAEKHEWSVSLEQGNQLKSNYKI